MAYRDFFIYTAEALALGASGTVFVRTNIDGDADFEIYDQAFTAISPLARVLQSETSSGRTLQDVPVALAGGFGYGLRFPYHLPISKRLKRASTFVSQITDESAVANQIRLQYIGAKVFKLAPFPQANYVAREPFQYTAPFVAVAVDPQGVGAIPAGGTGIFNIRIQEDADFEIRRITATADIAIPAASDCVALVELADVTYSYRFMDRPIPLETFGAQVPTLPNAVPAAYPFMLRIPKVLRHGSLLQVTVQNQSGALPLNTRITFHGSKCYTELPPDFAPAGG